jgi:hypothetical protein
VLQECRQLQTPIDFGEAVVAVAAVADLVEGLLGVDDSEDRQDRIVVEVDCILVGCSSHRAGPAVPEAFDRLLDTAALAVGDTVAAVAAAVENILAGAVTGIPAAEADKPLGKAGSVRNLVADPEEYRTDPLASTATTPVHRAKPRTRSLLYFLPDPTSLMGAAKQA